MKKTMLIAVFLAVSAGICFAQQADATGAQPVKPEAAVVTPPAPPAAPKPPEKITLVGVIDTVIPANPETSKPARITVLNETQTKMILSISERSELFNVTMKPIKADQLAKDMKVNIKYSTNAAKMNEVVFLKVLK